MTGLHNKDSWNGTTNLINLYQIHQTQLQTEKLWKALWNFKIVNGSNTVLTASSSCSSDYCWGLGSLRISVPGFNNDYKRGTSPDSVVLHYKST